MAAKEGQIISEIKKVAPLLGLNLYRNTVAQMRAPSGRIVTCGLGTGVSDLIGYFVRKKRATRKAIFCAVEVKTGRLKLTPKQEEFLEMVNEDGGIGLCVYSVEDFERQIKGRLHAMSLI